jgi:hypothetical protein
MDNIAIASAVFAGISALIAGYSAWVSKRALQANQQSIDLAKQASAASERIAADSLKLNEQIFKRQHVMDLHLAWHGTRGLDPSKFDDDSYIAEIVNAGNLLGLTATLWNHDVVEEAIIEQNYWTAFDHIYKTLASRVTTIPKLNKSGADFLTDDIHLAYSEMQELHEKNRKKRIEAVLVSTIGPTRREQ